VKVVRCAANLTDLCDAVFACGRSAAAATSATVSAATLSEPAKLASAPAGGSADPYVAAAHGVA